MDHFQSYFMIFYFILILKYNIHVEKETKIDLSKLSIIK